jgi:hypothetical protein
MDLLMHIREQRPAIDTMGQFAFFHHPKTAQKSILLGVLKKTTIIRPGRNYRAFLNSHSLQDFKKMFKFTIVRNPWDKMVSAFYHLQLRHPHIIGVDENFQDFVKTRFRKEGIEINGHFCHQYPNVYFKGKVFIDRIGRFENLKNDWKAIALKIGHSQKLGHRNKTKHEPHRYYYEDKECFDIVSEVYRKDIELFKYQLS